MLVKVPKMTIIRMKGIDLFYIVPGTLTVEEAARQLGVTASDAELVFQEDGYELDGKNEIIVFAKTMFQAGAEWARDHMYKELGGGK